MNYKKYHNGSLVFNEDALKILDEMAEKNRIVDCIVTDPPYKTTSRGDTGNAGGMLLKDINRKGNVFKHNNTSVELWASKLYNVLKEGGHCYVMTNHRNLFNYLGVLQEVGFHFTKSLVWNKGNKIMGQFYMSQFEYILFLRKGKEVRWRKRIV